LGGDDGFNQGGTGGHRDVFPIPSGKLSGTFIIKVLISFLLRHLIVRGSSR
jgi:hypothetical protein